MISKPRIGIIIPIIQKKYIKNIISLIFKTNNRKDLLVCVVNDGNRKINNYVNKLRTHNIEIINLKNNSCFAGANNAGWKYLINKFPHLLNNSLEGFILHKPPFIYLEPITK